MCVPHGYNVDPVVSSEMGLVRAWRVLRGQQRRAAGRRTRGAMRPQVVEWSDSKCPTVSSLTESFNDTNESFDLSDLEQELDADAEFDATDEDDDSVNVGSLKRGSEDAPVVKLVNMVLIDAIKRGASDIHIEPYEKTYRIRFRIDGILMESCDPTSS